MRQNLSGSINGGVQYSQMSTCMNHVVLSIDLFRCMYFLLSESNIDWINYWPNNRQCICLSVCLTNIQRSNDVLLPAE